MPQQITVTVYNFTELDPTSQSFAINEYIDSSQREWDIEINEAEAIIDLTEMGYVFFDTGRLCTY